MSKQSWINRLGHTISPTPVMPGVWRRKEGGFVVRGRVKDPCTGTLREVLRALPEATQVEAFQQLHAELDRIRAGPETTPATTMRFGAYAHDLFERKVALHEIVSEKSKQQWNYVLKKRLVPAFDKFFLDKLDRDEIEQWQMAVYRQIKRKEISPVTANGWLSILKVIMRAAADKYKWPYDPVAKVKPFDTSECDTYTDDDPNSLITSEVREFLRLMRISFPQHFGMTCLGFATGLRPSSLRPLRRGGANQDVFLDKGIILVRRSQTVGDVVMNTTKTGKKTGRKQSIAIPPELVDVLRWHIEQLPEGPMRDSDLLFPSVHGGFRAPCVLAKPFAEVAKTMKLEKHISPRAMRRTFQDLARAADVGDLVTRAISGHATETMQRHYSTVHNDEMRDGLARVIKLAGFRAALDAPPGEVVEKVVESHSAG